jgi:hypothetical protein
MISGTVKIRYSFEVIIEKGDGYETPNQRENGKQVSAFELRLYN